MNGGASQAGAGGSGGRGPVMEGHGVPAGHPAGPLSGRSVAAAPRPEPARSQVYLITSELGGGNCPGSMAWVIYFKIIGIKISRVVIYGQGEAQEARESPPRWSQPHLSPPPPPPFICCFHYDSKS